IRDRLVAGIHRPPATALSWREALVLPLPAVEAAATHLHPHRRPLRLPKGRRGSQVRSPLRRLALFVPVHLITVSRDAGRSAKSSRSAPRLNVSLRSHDRLSSTITGTGSGHGERSASSRVA